MAQDLKKVLEVKNLRTQFISKDSVATAVDDISFHINQGEVLGLVGESGCGKSVTALSIMNLFRDTTGKVTNGEIIYNGEDITKIAEREMAKIRGKSISMIFQEPLTSLNPVMKIGQQMSETILKHRKVNKKEAMEMSLNRLKEVGIPRAEQVLNEYPHQLSGGMNQRVMIAMGMSLNPSVLIADEPTTALDVTIQAQILELMKGINKESDMSILLITHDLGVVAEMCSRIIVMYLGRIVEQANVFDLFKNPLHPYTKGLIKSVPVIGKRVDRLDSIPGNVPTLKHTPVGCRFAPRCVEAFDKCHIEEPSMYTVDGDREVRCWLLDSSVNGKEEK